MLVIPKSEPMFTMDSMSRMDSVSDEYDDNESFISDPMSPNSEETQQEEDPGQKSCQKRKRQRLDHLSAEEKLMRRKLKNRVAAQYARDRKKAHMDHLEETVQKLEKDNKSLMKESILLKQENQRLQRENELLRQQFGLPPLVTRESGTRERTTRRNSTRSTRRKSPEVHEGETFESAVFIHDCQQHDQVSLIMVFGFLLLLVLQITLLWDGNCLLPSLLVLSLAMMKGCHSLRRLSLPVANHLWIIPSGISCLLSTPLLLLPPWMGYKLKRMTIFFTLSTRSWNNRSWKYLEEMYHKSRLKDNLLPLNAIPLFL